jgi:DNA-binding sugar fermentation-stimulating protein
MSESKAKERRRLAAAAAAAQPQVLVEIKVQYLSNNTIAANFPDTQDKKLLAQYVKMLLDAANIIIGQRLVPGEGGRIHLPPGVMNG